MTSLATEVSRAQALNMPESLVGKLNESKAPALNQNEKRKISPALSLFSGGVAGGVEATITYPFEFAKTRAQLQPTHSRNPMAVISQVIRQDGLRGVYTGCSTLILGTTFKAGVRFLSFDSIRNLLMDDRGRLSPARGILAGMIAGAVESIVAVTPTERVKTALIDDAKSGSRKYNGGAHALRLMISERGISEVYRGLASTTLKQSATSAVRMGSYNVIREVSKQYDLQQNSIMTFASGAVAGIITVYATQPFDSVKTKAQSAKGASTSEAFKSIVHERGIRGLWSGSTMRLGRLVLSGGIVFTVYEKVSGLLSEGR
ncbi:Tricarboxylate transport protein like [Verticillium longisporum]|nr:Tricarboxylate transport protein like [Verticillium longisporum]